MKNFVKIYVVRHVEAECNLEHHLGLMSKTKLTEKGLGQAKELANKLKKLNLIMFIPWIWIGSFKPQK